MSFIAADDFTHKIAIPFQLINDPVIALFVVHTNHYFYENSWHFTMSSNLTFTIFIVIFNDKDALFHNEAFQVYYSYLFSINLSQSSLIET